MFSFVTTTLKSTPQTYFQVVPGISKPSSGFDSPCYNGNGAISGVGAMNYVDCQPVANAWRAAGACRFMLIFSVHYDYHTFPHNQ